MLDQMQSLLMTKTNEREKTSTDNNVCSTHAFKLQTTVNGWINGIEMLFMCCGFFLRFVFCLSFCMFTTCYFFFFQSRISSLLYPISFCTICELRVYSFARITDFGMFPFARQHAFLCFFLLFLFHFWCFVFITFSIPKNKKIFVCVVERFSITMHTHCLPLSSTKNA